MERQVSYKEAYYSEKPKQTKVKEEKPKKKKRLHGFPKFLVIFFSIIIGIPVLLVGVVFACFYDGTHTNVPVAQNFTTEKMFNDIVVDSLDGATSESHEVMLGLSEFGFNSLLNDILVKNKQVNFYIKNLYVDAMTEQFSTVLEFDFYGFFKARLFITSHFSNEEINGENTIIFRITDLKLGRIGGLQSMVDFVCSRVALPDLTKMLADVGVHMEINLPKLTMTYKVKDLCNDIKTMMSSMVADNEFLSLVTEILTSDSFSDIRLIKGPDGTNLFSLGIDAGNCVLTEATHGIEGYVVPHGYFDSQLEYSISTIKSLFDSNRLGTGYNTVAEANLLNKYIMGEYALLNNEEKNEILRLKSLGVLDEINSPQYNYVLPVEEQLDSIIKSQLPTTITTDFNLVATTAQINNSLKCTTATGVISAFVKNNGTDDEPNYKINYVCSDRIGVIVTSNKLFIVINMNMNGFDTQLSIECPVYSTSEFGKLVFNVGSFRLGNIVTSDSIKQKFMPIIENALEGNNIIKLSGNKLTLDISTMLNEKGITSSNADVEFLLNSDTASTSGNITIHLSRKH